MSKRHDGRGIWEWQIVQLALGLSILLYAAILFFYEFTEAGMHLIILWSARISLVLFLLSFSASAVHRWLRTSLSFWLLMNRKYFGISFALSHLLHLLALLIMQLTFQPVFKQAPSQVLLGGGIAYFFVIAMYLTSFEMFSEYLSRTQWKRLHTLGNYWIWAVFMIISTGSLSEGNYGMLPFVVLLIFALTLKAYAYFRLPKLS